MKTIKFLTISLFLLSIIACKNNKKEEVKQNLNQPEKVIATPKTNAEISIAEGGKWVDGSSHKEYKGGTSFKNVTQLRVPDNHTDHSWYLRYEGPGWESNKVGYRLYLDWRNAIDIFGKTTEDMILSKIGQNNFDSYHEPQPWGQDILKVGNGLGIGSVGRLVNNKMFHFKEVDSTSVSIENTISASSIAINYNGWKTGNDKIDLKSVLSIKPDTRITNHIVTPSKEITGIVTGIVDHNVAYFKKESNNKKWGYIATYGKQTLVPDNLGMAIFYEIATTTEVKKGEFDYLIEFKPTTKPISYYFLAAWEQEVNGIKTENEFIKYLDTKLAELTANNAL